MTESKNGRPPFRADHVGSLLRPPQVHAARDDFAAGRIDAAQLRAIEDQAISAAVAMQEGIGLQSATDGEFRRATWHMDFIYQLGGISQAPGHLAVKFRNPEGTVEWTPAAIHVDSRLHLDHTIFEDDFRYLQSVVTTATPKLTIPSPNMVHYRGGPAAIDPAVYPDIEEFWSDLAAAYAEEVRRLAALGCTYLQLDYTSLAYLNDPAQRAMIAGRGEDAERVRPGVGGRELDRGKEKEGAGGEPPCLGPEARAAEPRDEERRGEHRQERRQAELDLARAERAPHGRDEQGVRNRLREETSPLDDTSEPAARDPDRPELVEPQAGGQGHRP